MRAKDRQAQLRTCHPIETIPSIQELKSESSYIGSTSKIESPRTLFAIKHHQMVRIFLGSTGTQLL